MGAENGMKMRIEVGDDSSPPNYTPVAGARTDSFNTEVGEIDITDKGSNNYKELLEGGIKSASLSSTGISKSRATMMDLLGKIKPYRVTWENGDKLEGNFQLGSYGNEGTHENSAVTFSSELRSHGEFTFTEGP